MLTASPYSFAEEHETTISPAVTSIRWVGFSTSHFELYTTNDERLAFDAAQRFEAVHDFFQQSAAQGGFLLNAVPELKVRVIAFRSSREFDAHRISPAACAYYQRTHSGDYIVMQDLSADHYQVGVHEYTHFLVRGAGLKLPLWLNEGLAEFYSSLESRDGQIFLGRPPYGRLRSLRTQPWIRLKALFSIEPSSPYYSQAGKMAVFYAESWALTHMLAMQPDYASEFPRFLTMVSDGTSVPEALQALYHKNPDQVTSDLNDYLQQRQLPQRVMHLNAAGAISPEVQPRPVVSAGANADFALADLAAANPNAASTVQLDEVSRKYPESPAAEESLGYFALLQHRLAEARAHFDKAVERHSNTPDALFYAAHLDLAADAPLGPAIELLQKALVLDPNHYNAAFDLGFAAAKANRFDLALTTLNHIRDVHPEHRYLLAYTLAYCYVYLDRVAEAQIYAEKAAGLAGNDADRLQTENLLRYIGYHAAKAQRAQNLPVARDAVLFSP